MYSFICHIPSWADLPGLKPRLESGKHGPNISPHNSGYGLLDNSIQHCWYTEGTSTAIRFRNFQALNKRRDVSPFKEGLNVFPASTLTEGEREVLDSNSVEAWGSFISAYLFPGQFDIFCRESTFQQLIV